MRLRHLALALTLLLCSLLLVSCGGSADDSEFSEDSNNRSHRADAPPLPAPYAKTITFAVNEDYDKDGDLADIAKDFKLVKQLGVDTMRVSFGWDDYEPVRGKYDFGWLHKFANLAQQHGLKLRPYLCYAPDWATGGGWNRAPKDPKDWYNFCYALAKEMKVHPNIVSWEIWNEENDPELWWKGGIKRYRELLKQGATAIRTADPTKQILFGGLTFPDDDWLRAVSAGGYDKYYDIVPFHCYEETWGHSGREIEGYMDHAGHQWFVELTRQGKGKPVWMNEMGYSTMKRSEAQQANFMCRSISYLLSQPEISHISWYEIRDQKPGSDIIGDAHNYHFGVTRWPDRKLKLAYHTLDMLTDLLDKKQLTPADNAAKVEVTAGSAGQLYHHLFKLADGSQVLFIYDKTKACTVRVALKSAGKTAHRYSLDNKSVLYPEFSDKTLRNIQLQPGEVQVFKVSP